MFTVLCKSFCWRGAKGVPVQGLAPRPCSNLFTMKHGLSASGRLASYWNAFLFAYSWIALVNVSDLWTVHSDLIGIISCFCTVVDTNQTREVQAVYLLVSTVSAVFLLLTWKPRSASIVGSIHRRIPWGAPLASCFPWREWEMREAG